MVLKFFFWYLVGIVVQSCRTLSRLFERTWEREYLQFLLRCVNCLSYKAPTSDSPMVCLLCWKCYFSVSSRWYCKSCTRLLVDNMNGSKVIKVCLEKRIAVIVRTWKHLQGLLVWLAEIELPWVWGSEGSLHWCSFKWVRNSAVCFWQGEMPNF